MAIYCGVAAVFAIIVAFSIPRIYKSSVMLAPESSGSSLVSNISSLASMVGMDINLGENNDAIFPEIYPDLMQSTKFLVGLFDIPVVSKDGEIKTTYYNYMKDEQKIPWWGYPSALLSNFIKSLKGKDRTMIIVTHEMGFAKKVSDKVIFMSEGQIVEQGSAKEVFNNPQSDKLKNFLASVENKE